MLLIAFAVTYAITPSAPDNSTNVSTESPTPGIGDQINTSGGTITTINFVATTQNPHWKGFVGNITGQYALMDSNNLSLYDWSLANAKGEIYATRQSTPVEWDSVSCATFENITKEETALGFLETDEDNINRTFNDTTHSEFYAGDTLISADSCPSTTLYVEGEKQSTKFFELLLIDENIVYTGLIEDAEVGYSNKTYDYQMIVPDNVDQGEPSEIYYFYIELI
jgi:hypothetical protein